MKKGSTVMRIGICIVLFFLILSSANAYSPSKYKPIHINNIGYVERTNYTVYVDVDYDGDMQSDFEDLRVKNETSDVYLPYWIEQLDDADRCRLWFKADHIPANTWCNDTFTLYYGDPAATDESNGDEVFAFFDDDFLDWKEKAALENAATYQNIPTYDGTGICTHPDVIYFPDGWNGYKYWMAFTPYSDSAHENPSIVVSNDGATWTVPTGLSNPIDPTPSSGHNADTDIVYNDTADELWLYYIECENGSTTYLKRRTSPDGVHWTNEQNVMSVPDYQIVSPSIVKRGTTYYMWYVDSGASGCSASSTTVYYRTSTDGLSWSVPQTVNITQSGVVLSDYVIWHPNVIYVPAKSEYWMIFAAYQSGSTCMHTKLFFANSTDGINWKTYNVAALIPSESGKWDSSLIYRSSVLYNATTDTIRVWYGGLGSSDWRIGYTEDNYTKFIEKLTESWEPKWKGDTSHGNVTNGILFFTAETSYWRTIYTAKTFSPNIAFRTRARFQEHTSTGGADWGFREGSSSVRFAEVYDTPRTIFVANGPGEEHYSNQPEFIVNSFTTWDIIWLSNNATFIVNTTECTDSPITTNVPTTNLPIRSYAKDTTFAVDWVFARGFNDPDPILLLGEEQEVSGVPCTTPSISSVAVSDITESSAVISWTTNQSADNVVKYSKNSDLSNPSWSSWDNDTSSVSITLTGLEPNTIYYYQVWSYNGTNSTCYSTDPVSYPYHEFTTLQATQECTNPVITGLTVSDITENSAVISWSTNQSSDNRVKYSKYPDLSSSSWSSWDNDTTSVSISLTGLESGTTYYYQAWSYNGTNSTCYTTEPDSEPYNNFTTLGIPPCTSPSISLLTASDITETTAVIKWFTNQSADNRVKYSKYSDLSNPSWSNWANDTTSIHITLQGLEPNTTYYYQAWSYNGTNSSCYTVEPPFSPYESFTTLQLSPFQIFHHVGVTWIEWRWTGTNGSSVGVMIDGVLVTNTTVDHYILSDLHPSERHTIDLVYNGTVVASDAASTVPSPTPYYMLFVFLLLCFLLAIFIRVEHFSAFFSLLAAILGIFIFKTMLLYKNTGLAIVSLMLGVISVIWLILAVISSIVKSRQEEEDWI